MYTTRCLSLQPSCSQWQPELICTVPVLLELSFSYAPVSPVQDRLDKLRLCVGAPESHGKGIFGHGSLPSRGVRSHQDRLPYRRGVSLVLYQLSDVG